ncbi:glycoside hydrolase [Phlyctema vagabunda]|uniref:Glycoside hydrolase n=1 Tax=Phlyctema vagabunda TaxID=108571 RepID=A0ABR4PL29_9HELO
MTGGIPIDVVGVAVGILLYSFVCLTLSLLLVCLLWSFGERWTYVALLTIFTSISTLASIIQQFHYALAWKSVKQAQYSKAVESLSNPSLSFGGAAQIVDVILYWIQFYCYNVMSLMVLFWAVALFQASWNLRTAHLGDWSLHIGFISKLFGVLFPFLVVGLGNCDPILKLPTLNFILQTITMFFNLTAGGILLAMILYKYIKTRRLTIRHTGHSHWWASCNSKDRSTQPTTGDALEALESPTSHPSVYDRALIIRFSIGFILLAAFETAIIVFAILQSGDYKRIAAAGRPDNSESGATIDILLFIPGVTASLVTFLVFGTTKSWQQYWNMVRSGCGVHTKLREHNLSLGTHNPNSGLAVHMNSFERIPSNISKQKGARMDVAVETNMSIRFQKPVSLQSSIDEIGVPIQPSHDEVDPSEVAAKNTNVLPV